MIELGTRIERIPVCVYEHRKDLLCVRDVHERESGLLTLGDLGPPDVFLIRDRGWMTWEIRPTQQAENGDER